MAIAPIDLQTLFTQADKIGKQVSAQKEGAAIQAALQQLHSQQTTEEKIRSVNEAQDQGEGSEGVRDRNGRKAQYEGEGSRKNSEDGAEAEGQNSGVIRDPELGRNIDLSL